MAIENKWFNSIKQLSPKLPVLLAAENKIAEAKNKVYATISVNHRVLATHTSSSDDQTARKAEAKASIQELLTTLGEMEAQMNTLKQEITDNVVPELMKLLDDSVDE